MSRKLIGDRPLTIAERQARYRQREIAWQKALPARLAALADGMERGEISREDCVAMVNALVLECATRR